MVTRRGVLAGIVALAAMIVPLAASAAGPGANPGTPELFASLPGGAASGSTIGPGGALYVPQPAAGEIWRIDPRSGAKTLYASGLPTRFPGLPFGGVMDVAFMGSKAYALVSVVGSTFPDDLVSCHPGIGIYRLDGPTSSTVVADIGAFACANPPPPTFPIVVPTGVQYALEPFRGGFLVTDGHHNRVLYATLDGTVSVLQQFGDAVPTGLAVSGKTVYLAEAGPVPHLPQNGKIVSFTPGASTTTDVAAGARLAVDVSSVADARCSRSRRATSRARTRTTARAPPGLRQIRTRALCCGRTRTERSRPSPTGSIGRARSRSSVTRPTSSRSAARSGRSTTSRVLPTGNDT